MLECDPLCHYPSERLSSGTSSGSMVPGPSARENAIPAALNDLRTHSTAQLTAPFAGTVALITLP
eukprot:1162166-Amphidinium_carterae.2